VSLSEFLKKNHVDVDGIFFTTWDGLFGDMEEYFVTWPWMNDIFG
jgi:hypothetical protein